MKLSEWLKSIAFSVTVHLENLEARKKDNGLVFLNLDKVHSYRSIEIFGLDSVIGGVT